MAELLTENQRLRPTTAIKRLLGTKNDSDIRRLQVKWKAEGKALLSQAQQRRERRRVSSAMAVPWQDPRGMQSITAMLGPWTTTRLAWLEPPAVKAAIEARARLAELFKPSPTMQAAIDAMKPSPAMQAAIDAMKPSPAMQALIDAMKPSPAMQALIDAMKPSPAMQALIDGMKPSPAMQVAIDEANRWRKLFE